LLNTKFKFIEIHATNVKYDHYNVDIVIITDLGKYIIEVDGEYFHGLIDLPDGHKFY
jgi:hypothetical protein